MIATKNHYSICRQEALLRDWCFCLSCGSEVNPTTHHIWPRSLGGGNEPFNLVTLCRSCHTHICSRCNRDLDKRVKYWEGSELTD